MSLIGNHVQIMDGPAAVIPLFFEKGTFLASVRHCSNQSGMGRPLKRRESQKTCLSYRLQIIHFTRLKGKIRVSRAELYVVEDFD